MVVSKPEQQAISLPLSDAAKTKYVEVDPLMLGKEQPKSKMASQECDKLIAQGGDSASVEYVKLKPNTCNKVPANKHTNSKVKSEPARAARGKHLSMLEVSTAVSVAAHCWLSMYF